MGRSLRLGLGLGLFWCEWLRLLCCLLLCLLRAAVFSARHPGPFVAVEGYQFFDSRTDAWQLDDLVNCFVFFFSFKFKKKTFRRMNTTGKIVQYMKKLLELDRY